MDVEQQIQAKGLTAPRVTPQDIEDAIDGLMYFTAADAATSDGASGIPPLWDWREKFRLLQCLTFCVIVLKNGFTVTGESACASPENFDAEIGRRIARENAIAKIWPLLGYELRTKLSA